MHAYILMPILAQGQLSQEWLRVSFSHPENEGVRSLPLSFSLPALCIGILEESRILKEWRYLEESRIKHAPGALAGWLRVGHVPWRVRFAMRRTLKHLSNQFSRATWHGKGTQIYQGADVPSRLYPSGATKGRTWPWAVGSCRARVKEFP